jgi:NAD(P)-dependent dehydrogenase (short-subunit alcohol dehydrogenase family)
MRLADKRVVVVGGGQTPGPSVGIGRACALTFAREGGRVLLVDREPTSMEETRSMIVDAGGWATTHVADITSEDDCRGIAAAAVRELGGVDVLYNGVGVHGYANFVDTTVDMWDRVMDVNLKGMWLTCKHVVPLMAEQRSGSVVNMSSGGAIRGGGATSYCVSKAGVNRLTLAIAAMYAKQDVRANAIMPGSIDTPMAIEGAVGDLGVSREQYVEQRLSWTPMTYKGTAWDVANAALFFASDESRFVSGNCLTVDGAKWVS